MSENAYAGKSFVFWAILSVRNRVLKRLRRQVPFFGLGNDKTKRDKRMRIGQLEEVVPIALVKPGERCEDEHRLFVLLRFGGSCNIVQMVVNDRRRLPLASQVRFDERCCGW